MTELATELSGPQPPLLVDVRTGAERATAVIEPSVHVELGEFVARAPADIPTEADVVVYCHSGIRSAQAAMWLKANGWPRARSLAGGIDEWSLVVDPKIPRY